MIFVKNSGGGREVNMMITLSKIGWDGGGSISIWIMPLNILFFLSEYPLRSIQVWVEVKSLATVNRRRLRNMHGKDHEDSITVAYGTVKAMVSNKGGYSEFR